MADTTAEATLERLIGQHHAPLLRMCCVILQDPALAEDAVQETFIRAYRGLAAFRQESSEKTWLTAIALNVCRDLRRSAWWRHVERRVTPEELPLTAPERDSEALALGQAIARLPEKCRDAVLLYYYQDMTLQEASAILHTSPSGLCKRLSRARELLKKELEVRL